MPQLGQFHDPMYWAHVHAEVVTRDFDTTPSAVPSFKLSACVRRSVCYTTPLLVSNSSRQPHQRYLVRALCTIGRLSGRPPFQPSLMRCTIDANAARVLGRSSIANDCSRVWLQAASLSPTHGFGNVVLDRIPHPRLRYAPSMGFPLSVSQFGWKYAVCVMLGPTEAEIRFDYVVSAD